MANDMELGIETVIEGDILEKGQIALDAKIFLDIVRKLPDSDVTIEVDNSMKTNITCEKAKFTIIGKSGEDFTYLPSIERIDSITVSQFTLKEVVRQTIFSIADNDNNKLMTGELFEINGDVLKVVSLDGHRISIRKINLKNSYPAKKVVVPGKTLSEVSKILSGDADKDVNIFFTGKHIVNSLVNRIVIGRSCFIIGTPQVVIGIISIISIVHQIRIENTVLDTIIPGRKGSFHRICCRWNSLLVIPDFGCVTHSVRRVERIFTSPLIKRSITSGSDYVRQLLDGYFLTLVPGNEFYLAPAA